MLGSELLSYTSDDQAIGWTSFDQPEYIEQGTKGLSSPMATTISASGNSKGRERRNNKNLRGQLRVREH
jgi:hypothetical protein